MSHPGHRSYDEAPPVGDVDDNEDAPGPLGVSRDYRTSVTLDHQTMGSADAADRWSGPREVTPRYFTGHQWTIAGKLASEDRAAVQLAMKQLGLIGPRTSIQLGAWDQTSANAFKQVLSWANVNGTTWVEALQDMQLQSATYGPAVDLPEPDPVKVTHPDDIERGLRDYFQERLGSGRAVPDEKIRAMVAAWQGEEIAAQRDTGPVVTGARTFETFADEQAQQTDPTAYDSRKVISGLQHVFSMFDGAA